VLYRSPGYGLTLLSQSTTSALHTSETISIPATSRANPSDHSTPSSEQAFQTPEDLALNAARALLEQVSRGGCVDESYQWLVCMLMVLGSEDVARCRMGTLTPLT
jgi:RNA 3'-terminal phosphate cyclase-like protein